jgi:hypothetical protein
LQHEREILAPISGCGSVSTLAAPTTAAVAALIACCVSTSAFTVAGYRRSQRTVAVMSNTPPRRPRCRIRFSIRSCTTVENGAAQYDSAE